MLFLTERWGVKMNLGIIALVILFVVIGVGFFKKMNVGMLAMMSAVILGYMTNQYSKEEILSGYSVSLFITLLGLNLLFGVISTNGVLDLLMKKLINLFGKQIWLAPVLLFLSGWAVSALAGGFAGLAFVVGVTIPVVHATGYDPIMMMIIANAGAQAGRYTQISPDGNIVLNLLAEQGIEKGLFVLTVNMTISMAVISILAFIWFKGYKVKGKGEIKLETGKLTVKHWITLAGFLVMVVSIMAFGKDSGLIGLMISVFLILIGVVDEKTAFKTLPWNTIMMVTGVGMLMNIVIGSGGIDILTNLIAGLTTPATVGGVSAMTASIMSWFSSTLGVVVPTLTPTVGDLAREVGGNVTAVGLLSCMLIGSSSACFSPASSVGGMILSSVTGDEKLKNTIDENKTFVLLFVWSIAMAIVSAVLALVGVFSIVG